ncbi:RNA polymerase sigma factor [Chitinophaga sp. GCM10012297]|uniref:Sigma-70 family RNA polymerase sigma factor n=1 Tax=Chitinophaga chungangae TaxID=2821488 RepID=A0ABS3YKY8_9BACT|nr:sigma-70 family RNA polymerase sigma factor [Chitinophaga chungangae]MBO9154779.1 sigma-70 family RNA polymerase sigma factor [Chitinophaga chungangae]
MQLRDGSQDAFRQLFLLFIKPLAYFAAELTGNAHEGEDIASNAFQKLWERRGGFSSIAGVKGFLYTAARNEALNVIRHRKVMDRAQQEMLHRLEHEPQWAEARMVNAELLRLIYAEIDNLPDNHRQMVLMSFVEELSTEEIASRLNISTAHVRTYKARAMTRLRSALLKKGLLEAVFLLWLMDR